MTEQSLHDWHRETFTKAHDVTLTFPAYSTPFGGNFPAQTRDVTLKSARTVVCQRTVNAMSPEEWKHAQAAFDASEEGHALEDQDAGVRREHCELWLLHRLYTAEHPELVAATELALYVVLDVHATPKKLHAHRARLVAHVQHGKPLEPPPAPKAEVQS